MSNPASDAADSSTRFGADHDFRAFYMEFMPQLVGFLIMQGGSVPDAADVAQDTMIKLHRRWSKVEQHRAWCRTTASRELVRRYADIREEVQDGVLDACALLPSPDEMSAFETRHDLMRALDRLPRRQRQLMAWSLEGYTPREIAEELSMEPDAVRASLMKARRFISKYLGNSEEERG
jgi:RNA polymerase sigma factor (sigma-70 family)